MSTTSRDHSSQLRLPLYDKGSILPTGKAHVSFSELAVWELCRFKHKLTYIDRVQEDKENLWSLYGSLVHEGIEELLRHPLWVSESPTGMGTRTGTEILELAQVLRTKFAEGLGRLGGFPLDMTKEEQESFTFDNHLVKVWTWLEERFPDHKIRGTEVPLFESIRPGRWFKGFIDLVLEDKDGYLWVLDWKTCRTGWSDEKKADATRRLQLALYKVFLTQLLGVNTSRVKAGWVLLKRLPEEDDPTGPVELVSPVLTQEDLNTAMDKLRQMVATVERGWYTKNRYSCTYCQFANTTYCP